MINSRGPLELEEAGVGPLELEEAEVGPLELEEAGVGPLEQEEVGAWEGWKMVQDEVVEVQQEHC